MAAVTHFSYKHGSPVKSDIIKPHMDICCLAQWPLKLL